MKESQTDIRLTKYAKRKDFVDFLCYREEKWLQYSNLEEKLKAIFGSVENGLKEFKNDIVFNKDNFDK